MSFEIVEGNFQYLDITQNAHNYGVNNDSVV